MQIILYRNIKDTISFLLTKKEYAEDLEFISEIAASPKSDIPQQAADFLGMKLGLMPNKITLLDTKATLPLLGSFSFVSYNENVFTIPQYFLAYELAQEAGEKIYNSSDYNVFEWYSYSDAMKKLTSSNSRIALWELNTRLDRNQLNDILFIW